MNTDLKGECVMRSMKPWDHNQHPIQRFKNEVDNLFSRVFNESFLSTPTIFNKDGAFTPKCNINEKRDRYLVEVEVPGVNPQDIEIELEGNTLTIKGERKQEIESEDEEKRMHVVEHSYGSFYRSFTLPDNVHADEIKAENKNGILIITLPKDKTDKPRRITID